MTPIISPMKILSHQQLDNLIEALKETMPEHSQPLPDIDMPFDVKTFVIRELRNKHYQLCMLHIHDMQQSGSGATCRYCSFGWAGISGSSAEFKTSVEV